MSAKTFLTRCMCCCLFTLCLFTVLGQQSTVRFFKLSMDDGLADDWVHNIILDDDGLMWFATHDGLSRYDGYHFKNYKVNKRDSTALPGSVVMDIAEGEDGIYWLACNGIGLVRFDARSETFRGFTHDPDDPNSISQRAATTVFVDSDQDVWVGTFEGGINRYLPETQSFKRYTLYADTIQSPNKFEINSVREIREDPSNPDILWLAAHNGVYRLDKNTDALQHFPMTHYQQSPFAVDLHIEKDGIIWVASENLGLLELDPATGESVMRSDYYQMTGIAPKSEHEFWVGTKGKGLGIYDKKENSWEFIQSNALDPNSILSNDIWSIYKDRENRLWVCDRTKGISCVGNVGKLMRNPVMPDSIGQQLTNRKDFAFDAQSQTLYASTGYNENVFAFKKSDRQYRFYKLLLTPIGSKDQTNRTLAIHVDQQHQLWMLSKADGQLKLLQLDENSQSLKVRPLPGLDTLAAEGVENASMVSDQLNRLWIALPDGKLFRLDGQDLSLFKIGKDFDPGDDLRIWDLLLDRQNRLWACSLTEGVFMFNPDTQEEKHFNYLEGKGGLDAWRILGISETADGKMWVGTSAAGIQELHPDSAINQFMPTYDQFIGMPDDKINGLVTDRDGTTWVAASRGLIKANPQRLQFQLYGKQEGLDNEFLDYGLELLPNGDLMIGQPLGFQYLIPEEAIDTGAVHRVRLSQLWVNNERYPTEPSIAYLDQLELGPDENYFRIDFSALYMERQDDIRYRYKLQNYDADWSETRPGEATAAFTNVPPGNYTFQVMAANGAGDWNEQITELPLTIRPHWYWDTWSILTYALILIGILTSLVVNQLRRMRLSRELAIEKIELENTREMEKLKSEMLEQSESLLLNILPEDVATELKKNGKVKPRTLSQSTVMFLDLKNFTPISKTLSPRQLIDALTELFSGFDRIMDQHQLERIKTIGDAYMAFGGMQERDNRQAVEMIKASLEILEFLKQWNQLHPQMADFEARIGIHTGPVIAGVVGVQKFAFDIWGETVNLASRLESSSQPGQINISEATYQLTKDHFQFDQQAPRQLKGVGEVVSYFVRSVRNSQSVIH